MSLSPANRTTDTPWELVAMTPQSDSTPPARGPLELSSVFAALRAGRLAVVAAMIVGLGGGVVVSNSLPRSYEASATVRVDPFVVDQVTQSGRNSNSSADGLAIEARSDAVLAAAAAQLEPTLTVPDLRVLVTVSQDGDDPVLQIVARTASPERSADIANAVAAAVLEQRRTQIDGELNAAATALEAEIGAARFELLAVESELAAVADPELVVTRDQLARRLELLTETEIRGQNEEGVDLRRIRNEIEAVQAELVTVERELAARRNPEVLLERETLAGELALLQELQLRSQLVEALPGQILRSAVPPTAPAGTSPLVNGLAVAVLAGGATLAGYAVRQRSLISRRDIESLCPVVAEIPAVVPSKGRRGLAPEAELGRLDLWFWAKGSRAPLLISCGNRPVASMLARHLGRYRGAHNPTNVIDFEHEILSDARPLDGITVLAPSAISGLRTELLGQAYLMVSPSTTRASVTLEAALTSDAIVLVIDQASARYRDVLSDLDRLGALGLRVDGAVVITSRRGRDDRRVRATRSPEREVVQPSPGVTSSAAPPPATTGMVSSLDRLGGLGVSGTAATPGTPAGVGSAPAAARAQTWRSDEAR